jgi:DNA-binding MarR family transcriptional regulator
MPGKSKDALTSELVDALVQLTFAVHGVLVRVAGEFDLSVTQLRLLGIVRDRTPPMTAIAEHLGLDRSSVTGLVDRAEQRGLVVRTPSAHDARVITVSPTPEGLRIGKDLVARVTDEIGALVGHLPKPDRECVVRLATSIENAEVMQALSAPNR